MTEYSRPIPVADEVTSTFWEEARRHQLVFQRCQHCGTFAHPPVAFCRNCHNLAEPSFRFERVGLGGKIINWTVMHDQMVSGFAGEPPWVHALVEMDEQGGLTFAATLEGGVSDRLKIGAPVEVVFEDVTSTVTLPHFKYAAADSGTQGDER